MKILLIILSCVSLATLLLVVALIVFYLTASCFHDHRQKVVKEENYIRSLVIPMHITNGEESLRQVTEELNSRIKTRLDGRIDRVTSISMSEAQNDKYYITAYYIEKGCYYNEQQYSYKSFII